MPWPAVIRFVNPLRLGKICGLSLRPLQLFCAVAEHRSFSRAARDFGVTQSAVSQAVANLEDSIGVQLIDRRPRPWELTTAGERFLDGSRAVLRSYRRLCDDVRRVESEVDLRLTVGSVVSVGLAYLPDAVDELSRRRPGTRIDRNYGTTERVAEMVESGEVEVGLVSFARGGGGLTVIPWLNEPMRIVCSDRHPLAESRDLDLVDLDGVDMIGFGRNLRIRREVDSVLDEADVVVEYVEEFDNADSMIRGIQASRGIGILPEAAVRPEIAAGQLRVLSCRGFRMTRPLSLVFRRGEPVSDVAAEFAAVLVGRDVRGDLGVKAKNGSPVATAVSVVA